MLADERQLQLKEREDHVAKLKVQLNMCSANKEFQALKEQIAADEQATSVLSDEILETLEKMDTLESLTKKAQANLAKTKEELDKTRKRVAEQQVSLEADLARVTAELEKAEAQLPADFKTDYERIIKGRGEDALAQVEGETCGGCYQLLTPQTMSELIMARPVFCKSCGRLLYLPEDRSVGG
jgi:predicted  nucleic acid-binding Zn-ribbon protein